MANEIDWAALDQIEGWMLPDAADLMKRIASHDVSPGVLELGVFKGKLLAVAAALFAGPVVGVDAMWNGLNNPLESADIEDVKKLIRNNVAKLAPGVNIEIVVSDTTLLTPNDISPLSANGFGFISVDAGHDPDPVVHDLGLATELLAPGGVIFLDDGFNSACPGVGEGMFRFLSEDRRLKAFATGYNKTLFTDSESHSLWLSRAYEWVRSGEEPMFERTRAQISANIAARWAPTLCGSEIVPFV